LLNSDFAASRRFGGESGFREPRELHVVEQARSCQAIDQQRLGSGAKVGTLAEVGCSGVR
jgi:hypothetical protein